MSDLLKENSRVKVIKDGNFVIKKYKSLSDEANKILLAKLEVKDKFSDIEGIVIPTDYTKENGKVNEIITPYIDKPNFYVSLNHPVYDLKTIALVMENLQSLIKQGNDRGLIFTDFVLQGNLRYDPITHKPFIIDYDGYQVDNIPASSLSAYLLAPPFRTKKYYTKELYTRNADLMQLLLRWYSLCTGLDFLKTGIPNVSNAMSLVNLTDKTMVSHFNKLFLNKYNNDDLKGEFMRMYKDYEVVPIIPGLPKPRAFIKKN